MTQDYFEWLMPGISGVQLQFLMSGHWITQAIGVAADLGIADLLSDGPKTSGEFASDGFSPPGDLPAYARTSKRWCFH